MLTEKELFLYKEFRGYLRVIQFILGFIAGVLITIALKL